MLVDTEAPMAPINANRIVGTRFPTDEGRRLAEVLLSRFSDWSTLRIDLTSCDSALLISAFFNSFLQTVSEKDLSRLNDARKIDWNLQYSFQKSNVEEWMRDFQPYSVY